MDKTSSFVWGLAVSFVSSIPASLVYGVFDGMLALPVSLLTSILIYLYYLKPKKVQLGYFIIGYFFLAVIAIVFLGAILGVAYFLPYDPNGVVLS